MLELRKQLRARNRQIQRDEKQAELLALKAERASASMRSTAEIHREMHRDRDRGVSQRPPSAQELEISEIARRASKAKTAPKAKPVGKSKAKVNPSGHADAVALPSVGLEGLSAATDRWLASHQLPSAEGGDNLPTHATRRGLTKLEQLSSSDSRR